MATPSEIQKKDSHKSYIDGQQHSPLPAVAGQITFRIGNICKVAMFCALSLLSQQASASEPDAPDLSGTDYYLDATDGSDANDGKSRASAWRTLSHANQRIFQPGDRLLLRSGQTFEGKLVLDSHDSGDLSSPVTISRYYDNENDPLPIIDAKRNIAGVHISNASHIIVENLEITADGGWAQDGQGNTLRAGVYVSVDEGKKADTILLSGLNIHDIFPRVGADSEGCNDTTHKGYGIFVKGYKKWSDPDAETFPAENVTIKNCTIETTGHTGIRGLRVDGLSVSGNELRNIGGPGIQPSSCNDVYVGSNTTDGTGAITDSRMHGRGSGIWPWSSENVLIEHNVFKGARGRHR